MAIEERQNGEFIDEEVWNELVDEINANSASTSSNTSGLSTVNTKLNKTTQNGGISNIASRLSSIESKDTSQDSSLSTITNRLGTGVGTDDIDGSSAVGTAGAQLQWLRNNSGGGGGGGVAPGAYRLRAIRTTGGNMPHDTTAVYWTEAPEYAVGMSIQNNTRVHLEHPGFYLVTTSLCLSGTITNGNRFQIWVSPSDNPDIRYGADQFVLPSRYPLVCCTAMVRATEPMDISVFSWNDATVTTALYTNNQYCALSVAYLGPA